MYVCLRIKINLITLSANKFENQFRLVIVSVNAANLGPFIIIIYYLFIYYTKDTDSDSGKYQHYY